LDLQGAHAFLIFAFIALFVVCMSIVMIIPYWKIYEKTGQAGPMALLQLIPLVNIVMLYVLAFSEWPIEREMRTAREGQR
jgi:hypothetical protein